MNCEVVSCCACSVRTADNSQGEFSKTPSLFLLTSCLFVSYMRCNVRTQGYLNLQWKLLVGLCHLMQPVRARLEATTITVDGPLLHALLKTALSAQFLVPWLVFDQANTSMIDFKVVLNLQIGWSTRIRRAFVLNNTLYQLINGAEIRMTNDATSNVSCWVLEKFKC